MLHFDAARWAKHRHYFLPRELSSTALVFLDAAQWPLHRHYLTPRHVLEVTTSIRQLCNISGVSAKADIREIPMHDGQLP